MLRNGRRTALALLTMLAASAHAQENTAQESDTVGPPALRNFSLGNPAAQPTQDDSIAPRTLPPAQNQTEEPLQPVTIAPPPPTVQQPRQAAPDRRTQQPPRSPPSQVARPPAPQPSVETPLPPPEPETQTPVIVPPTDPDAQADLNIPQAAEPVAPAARPEQLVDPSAVRGTPDWLYLLVAVVLGLAGYFAYRRFAAGRRHPAEEPVLADVIPEPVPVAAPPAAIREKPEERPSIELEFKPEQAVVTDKQASVRFHLTVRNGGKGAARKVRLDASMFNAGARQDQEIGAFFSAPLRGGSAPVDLVPGAVADLRTEVVMPRSSVREVKVNDRTLFIPMVAINLIYEWGDGRKGQTSMSYLVGREPQAPSDKMAPFRLDLGPRIYRSLGQRQGSLARVI